MDPAIKNALDQLIDKQVKEQPLLSNELTSEDLSLLYNLAHGLYEAGDYTKALEIFQCLTLNQSLNPKHWMGLASTLQMQKNYQHALTAWSVTAILSEDPIIHFHAADCLWMLGEKEKAMLALDEAENALNGSKAHHELKDKIAVLKQQWSQL